jgi:hypothetical protein
MPTPIPCSVALVSAGDADRSPRHRWRRRRHSWPITTVGPSRPTAYNLLLLHPHRRPDPVEPGAVRRPAYRLFASLGSSGPPPNHAIEDARTFIREFESEVSDRLTRRRIRAPFPIGASRPGWSKCGGRLTYQRRVQKCAGLWYLSCRPRHPDFQFACRRQRSPEIPITCEASTATSQTSEMPGAAPLTRFR